MGTYTWCALSSSYLDPHSNVTTYKLCDLCKSLSFSVPGFLQLTNGGAGVGGGGEESTQTSLVVQELRFHTPSLPMQGS